MCSCAGVLAIIAAIVGFTETSAIFAWKLEHAFPSAGQHELVMTDPRQPLAMQVRFAVAFAWPAIAVALSMLVYRLRAHADASWRKIGTHVAIAAVAFVVVMFVPTLLMGSVEAPDNGLKPMILISELAPGASELEAGITLVLALVFLSWLSARPRQASR